MEYRLDFNLGTKWDTVACQNANDHGDNSTLVLGKCS